MGQDDRINFVSGDRCVLPVPFAPFLLALEHPAINQHLDSFFPIAVGRCVNQMFRTGHCPGRAKKLYIGQVQSSMNEMFRAPECAIGNDIGIGTTAT